MKPHLKNKSSFVESKGGARITKVSETHEQLPSKVVFVPKETSFLQRPCCVVLSFLNIQVRVVW